MLERIALFFKHLSDFLLSLVRISLLSKPGGGLQQVDNRKPLLILGNGPSLTDSLKCVGPDIEKYELMAVNFFADTALYQQLKPRFYVLAAPEFWLNDVNDSWIENRNRLFSNLTRFTSWPLFVFIPFASRKYLLSNNIFTTNPNIKIVYFNTTPIEGWSWFTNTCFSLKLGMPRPHNVLIPSIWLALNTGFREIFLIGADHSWLPQISVDEYNNVLINQQHFYDSTHSKPETMKKLGRGTRKLHEVLRKFMLSFEGYFILKNFADYKKASILNATPASFIDAFERIKLINCNN
jgi:hypothetical protein